MLRGSRAGAVWSRRTAGGNSMPMNRFIKNMHKRDATSLENSVNPALDSMSQRPDIMRHMKPIGSRRMDDPEALYARRLATDNEPQLISEVKSRMMENELNEPLNMSAWEFQKRPWKVYGPNQVPYHQTHIVSIQIKWNNIRFYMMDMNWERFYEGKDQCNDFANDQWRENFFPHNEFFTKLGPYGNCHLFSSMRGQGFMGSSARVEANVEYVAGKFGSEILNHGYQPYVRVVIDYWGKTKMVRGACIKGLLSSGVKIVSFTEGTVDAEWVQPKLIQRRTSVSPENVGMWDRFYKAKDSAGGKSPDEPE